MKHEKWIDLVKHSLKSFHIQLLIYLLIISFLPMTAALLLFNQQSVHHADRQLSADVSNMNRSIIKQLRGQMEKMPNIAEQLNSDYYVQRVLKTQTNPTYGGHPEDLLQFKIRMNTLRTRAMDKNPFITDVCVHINQWNLSVCDSTSMLLDKFHEHIPVTTDDTRMNMINGGKLRYVAPLYDTGSYLVKGYIVMEANVKAMIQSDDAVMPDWHLILYDNQDQTVYDSLTAKVNGKNSGTRVPTSRPTLMNKQTLEMSEYHLHWTSQLEVPNKYVKFSASIFHRLLLYILIIMTAVSVLSSVIFTRMVTNPINHLGKLMKRAELGDLKAYWNNRGTKEINDLGHGFNQMLNRVEELIKQVKREEALKMEAEMEALQYQLNPHFLYNTLNTIKWVAKMNRTPQISDAVSSLVRLLQASLGKLGDFITLDSELKLISDYLQIQTFRFGDTVTVEMEIAPETRDCIVPKFILQPLVENAFVHGVDTNNPQTDGKIKIRSYWERDLLILEVEDNGPGRREAEPDGDPLKQKDKMSGIGLKHIRDKIKLYYGNGYSMNLVPHPHRGMISRLILPIQIYEEI